ncbi:MAG: alpha/beta fold hydrolase [Pseudonocardiaceae bacterium]
MWSYVSTGVRADGDNKGVTRSVPLILEVNGFGPDAYGGTRAVAGTWPARHRPFEPAHRPDRVPSELVADALAVLDANGVERRVLVGNSLGGARAPPAVVTQLVTHHGPERQNGLVQNLESPPDQAVRLWAILGSNQ